MARHPGACRWLTHAAQRGATAISMLLMMLFLFTMLGVAEVGYLYWAKRDTQKIADLAALAGAQQLNACASDNSDNSVARGNAQTENHFSYGLTIACGTWDPVANAGVADHFAATAYGNKPNAVKVTAQRPVLPIWGMAGRLPSVSASAVASGQQPVAVFSVGSTLATVDPTAPLGQLLKGVGLDLSGVSLAGYNGLATATITPAGLLNQLGVQVPANITVGGLNTLLASSVQANALIDVLNAIVTVAGQQQLVSTNATLVNAITASSTTALNNVTLGSNNGQAGGLFAQIVGPDSAAQSALNARVNALQLISTAIGVATRNHALTVTVPPTAIPGLTLTANASVIEPPAIGIGGVGTKAYTAQIRAFVRLQIASSNVPLIGGLLNSLVNIKLDMPIAIDLVNAQATLTDLCTQKDACGRDLATISVASSVLKTCVGNFTQADAFSTAGSCDQIPGANTDKTLLAVSLGSSNTSLANVTTHVAMGALPASGSDTFYAGKTENLPANGTPLTIGSTVSNLFSALLQVLIGMTVNTNASSLANNLGTDLWNANAAAHTGATPNNNQLAATLNQLSANTATLGSFLQNAPQQVTDLLGSTLTLNLGGVLAGASGLVGGLLNAVGSILGNTACALSTAQCIQYVQNTLSGTSNGVSNGLLGVLGLVIQTLKAPLDALGTTALSPLLTNTLGVNLGVSTVNLQSLQCHGVQLVY